MTTHGSLPPEKITKEIRFAVVMYGGISLAIYMNGIAQELLNMVRGTSPIGPDPDNFSDTARVYRDIADYLSDTQNNGAFNHRFVVDIISGTSAGGINGICLAKALAGGLDNLKTLEQTWLKEGDIDYLLNDKKSEPKKYQPKEPKTSLFNSQRMYGKLFDAFRDMQKYAKDNQSHISSLDLFVTATDLRGIQLPIKLKDGQENEKIYKHVFPFTYRKDPLFPIRQLNHFSGDFDCMLAFAARCTSSIPPAFEPVSINDIKQYLASHAPDALQTWNRNISPESSGINWNELFFSAYAGSGKEQNLNQRQFADGGYLDNRPFGHAIQGIYAREADCMIERKLLYIDPNPEKAEENAQLEKNISFIENLALASTALPRYETIREEISGVEQRNEWIKSVNNILKKLYDPIDKKLKEIATKHFLDYLSARLKETALKNIPDKTQLPLFYPFAASETNTLKIDQYTEARARETVTEFWKYIADQSIPEREREACSKNDIKNLDEMVDMFGCGYTAYHYTRLDAVSEALALMILKAMNAEIRDDLYKTVLHIVQLWRNHHYQSNPDDAEKKDRSENYFFRKYDLGFRIRRLNLFREKIEKSILKQSTKGLYFGLFQKKSLSDDIFTMTSSEQVALTVFYEKNVEALRSLYRLRSLLLSTGGLNPLNKDALKLRHIIDPIAKSNVLDEIGNTESFNALNSLPALQSQNGATESLTSIVERLLESISQCIKDGHTESADNETIVYKGTVMASDIINNGLRTLGHNSPVIAGCMRYLYDYGYDLYDMTTFPLLANGKYGEGTPIDVHRISPVDATSLWNEQQQKKSKLAGIALGSFGGFLDEEWRHNDIMWGRLDAAERLISITLPEKENEQKRNQFIRKAQFAILNETTNEWISQLGKKRFISEETRASDQYNRIKSIYDTLKTTPNYDGIAENPKWKETFRQEYDFNRKLDPPPNLQRLGRSSSILSSMIQGLENGKNENGNGIISTISDYLKKLSWIILGMLDFSMPKSFGAILSRYWLRLILLTSVILVALGVLFGGIKELQSAGNVLMWTGIILAVLDVSLLLLQYKTTEIIHEQEPKSSIPFIIKGGLSLLLAIIIIVYTVMQLLNN